MNLEFFIARRYLHSRGAHSVINHIARVSIVAMAVPVAALIVVVSVFNGLECIVSSLYRAIDPDLTIRPSAGTTLPIEQLPSSAIAETEGVEAFSFTLEQGAMVEYNGRRAIVKLKGVDHNYTHTLPIAERIAAGEFSLEEGDMVVASGVMNDLGLTVNNLGSEVKLFAIDRTRFSTILPISGYSMQPKRVVGAYNIDEDNSHAAIISLGEAQRLLRYDGRISQVAVRLSSETNPMRVAEQLQQSLGEGVEVLTREQSNSLYRLMALEKWGAFGIAALVLLIASLSIVGTIVMAMIEKREDMHTLRTMGASDKLIGKIFISEGVLMALLSGVSGVAVGVGLTLLQQHLGLIRLDTTSLSFDAYPVELRWGDVAATIAVYVVIALSVIVATVRAMLRRDKANKAL